MQKPIPALVSAILALMGTGVAAGELPTPLVHLADIDATIVQDMRYAGTRNFTGARVPGYDAPECILTREAAGALKRVHAELAKQGYGLMVYDCYRPTRSVRSFVRWVSEGKSTAETQTYMPNVAKRSLIAAGYIASRSQHSTGRAVDLTIKPLVDKKEAGASVQAQGERSACTAAEAERGGDGSLDMGTGYDCFDSKSHTFASGLTAAQKKARSTLLVAMQAHGFSNYTKEWWHFTYSGGSSRSFDVPVSARAAQPGQAGSPDVAREAISTPPPAVTEPD